MNAEERKQLVRQLMEEAVTSGDLEPLQAHPGLHEIIPTLQRVLPTLSNRSVSFPLQFAGETAPGPQSAGISSPHFTRYWKSASSGL